MDSLVARHLKNSPLLLLCLLFLQAEAGTFPLLFLYFDLFFTPRDFAQLWGNGVIVATQVASVVAAPIATLILTTLDGAAGQAGWRWVFFILGTAALGCGVLVGVSLMDPPETTNVFTRSASSLCARGNLRFASLITHLLLLPARLVMRAAASAASAHCIIIARDYDEGLHSISSILFVWCFCSAASPRIDIAHLH